MNTFIKKAAAVIAAIMIIGGLIVPETLVYAADNYYTTSPDRIRSAVLIIGDSRIAGMMELSDRVAFNATIGAHWHTGYKTLNTRISIGTKRSTQKALVRAILKKYGQCHVVLSATINDIDNPDTNDSSQTWWYNKSFFGMRSTMSLLSKVSVKYKGRTVKPKFYIMGIIQDEGVSNPAVNSANRKMASAGYQKRYGYKYLADIGYSSEENSYLSDGCHFTTENSIRVFNAIMEGIGKSKWKI